MFVGGPGTRMRAILPYSRRVEEEEEESGKKMKGDKKKI